MGNLANELQSDATGNVYTYDARGWRVKRTATAAASFDGRAHVRYAIYDANHQLKAVRDSDIWRDFIHLGTRPIARIEGTATTWILGNYQNSPLIETNAAGQVTRLVTQRGIVRADGFWLRRLVHRGRGWGAGTTA